MVVFKEHWKLKWTTLKHTHTQNVERKKRATHLNNSLLIVKMCSSIHFDHMVNKKPNTLLSIPVMCHCSSAPLKHLVQKICQFCMFEGDLHINIRTRSSAMQKYIDSLWNLLSYPFQMLFRKATYKYIWNEDNYGIVSVYLQVSIDWMWFLIQL